MKKKALTFLGTEMHADGRDYFEAPLGTNRVTVVRLAASCCDWCATLWTGRAMVLSHHGPTAQDALSHLERQVDAGTKALMKAARPRGIVA